MNTMIFDTLKAAEGLEAAGLDEGPARAIVTTMRQVVNENVATKADLLAVKSELKGDLAAMKADVTALKWVGGFQSTFILAMAARLFGLF